jgi:large repetitive protein
MRRILAVLSVLLGTMAMGMVSVPITASVAGADAPNAVYVSTTGNDANAGTATSPFATIGHALGVVASGGTVHVGAGTYNESLTIDKPVALDGAQSGVDARTRSGAESVITGSGGVVYTAGATTGTIDGFTLQGYTGSTSEIKASDVGSGWDFSNDIIDVSYGGIYLNSDGASNPATTTISHDSFVQAIPSSASSGYYGGAVNMWSQAGNAADNVTVSDNSFTNLSGPTGAVHTGSNPSCTSAGPGTDPADYAKNLTVSGNTFTDTGNDENFLVAFCTSGATVTDNTVTVNDPGDNNNASTGMYLGGGNYGMDLSSNSLTAVGLPAGAISLNSIFNPGGTGDVISGNTITGWTKGVQVAGGQSPAPTGFSVTDNNVSGASAYGVEVLTYEGAMPTGGSLTGNSASGSGTDDCYDNTTGAGTAGTGNTWAGDTGITSSPAGLCQPPSSVYVSTTGNDANAGTATSPFATIGHALGVVASGGTVHVGAGTYNENVHITQPATLLGANAGTAGTSGSRGAESIISTSNAGSNQDLTVQVSSPGVTVSGFTIQQTSPTTCAYCAAFGVQVDPNATGATVTDNIIGGMSSTQTAPTRGGNPIGVDVSGNGGGTPDNVTVSDNLIENVAALGTQHVSALGIEVGDSTVTHVGTGLVISGNHITGVSSAAWGAYGIIFNRPTSGSQVVGNTIDTISGGGWAHAIGLEGNETSPIITNNAISNVSSPSSDSLDIYSDSTDLGVATATITNNSLGGGTAGGIGNDSPGTLSAAGNWWGCVNGPDGGTGCTVTGGAGSFNLSPWIVSYTPDPAHAGQPGFWPTAVTSSTSATITSADNTTFQAGAANTFTLTASGIPAPAISESNTDTLPSGVTFDPATGVLAGTPTAPGTYTLHFTAHNGSGADATQTFTLSVNGISSASSAQTVQRKHLKFTVTTVGHPTAIVGESGMPAWMTLKGGTGVNAGTAKLGGVGPVGGGNFTFTLTANYGGGHVATQLFTVHVFGINSAAAVNFSRSGPPTQSFTITTIGNGAPVTISTHLGAKQSGLSFVDNGDGTATISGKPGAGAKTQVIKVTAKSGAFTATQKLAIGISS